MNEHENEEPIRAETVGMGQVKKGMVVAWSDGGWRAVEDVVKARDGRIRLRLTGSRLLGGVAATPVVVAVTAGDPEPDCGACEIAAPVMHALAGATARDPDEALTVMTELKRRATAAIDRIEALG